jgi:hypothetical protein
MMTLAALIACAALGFWAGVVYRDAIMVAQHDAHKRQMDDIFEEVARLRAQVAGLVGKE